MPEVSRLGHTQYIYRILINRILINDQGHLLRGNATDLWRESNGMFWAYSGPASINKLVGISSSSLQEQQPYQQS